MSWLHNCTIIRLIHKGSNYHHTKAATAHPCCQHVLDLPRSLGKPWVWEGWESPPSASSGPAEILHLQVFWNTSISSDGTWPIWRYRLSTTFGNFPCLKRDIGSIYKYCVYIYIYIQNISKDWLLNWPPSKFISFQTSPSSRRIHHSAFLYDWNIFQHRAKTMKISKEN